MSDSVILWQRLDRPGHEAARLVRADSGWHLVGTAVFAHAGEPCRLDYRVVCDATFRTGSAAIVGWVGMEPVDIDIDVDATGGWRMNGEDCPQLDGCVDVDLNFSPSTNLLPIRRLNLALGAATRVRAAWLRFPSFVLEPLDQTYRRLAAAKYRYESGDGAFAAELDVNPAGFVTRYAGFWEAVR